MSPAPMPTPPSNPPDNQEETDNGRDSYSFVSHIIILSFAILLVGLKYYADNRDPTLEQFSNYIYFALALILFGEIAFITQVNNRFTAAFAALAKLRQSDPIAGYYSGDALTSMVEREVARAGRAGRALAILMIDVASDELPVGPDKDGMGRIAVIRKMTQLIRQSTRTSDMIGQFQPGELALVLPDTPTDHAAIVADKLRKRIDGGAATPEPGRLTVKLVTARQAEDGAGIVWSFDEILEARVVQRGE